jgi:predicted aconitase with swiveling domain
MHRGGGDWKMEQLKGRLISKGKGEGEALVTTQPISFYGGVDPNTGVVIEKGHELQGQSVRGKILVFPTGKGSTVGSYTLYRMKKNGTAPAAIVNRECETVVAVGVIISEIPCVDKIDISKIKTGTKVYIENDTINIS